MKKLVKNNYVLDVKNGHWTELPEMQTPRYSHSSLYLHQTLYVFGGGSKAGEDNILKSVEKLDLYIEEGQSIQKASKTYFRKRENKYVLHPADWQRCKDASFRRCNQFTVGLPRQNKILLLGGYTGDKHRSKIIEIYNVANDNWTTDSLRMLHGVERGVILPYSNYEILILGGRNRNGDTNQGVKYNLKDNTYIYGPQSLILRVLQKCFIIDGDFVVMGGQSAEDEQTPVEIYSGQNDSFSSLPTNYKAYFKNDALKSYAQASQNILLDIPNNLA